MFSGENSWLFDIGSGSICLLPILSEKGLFAISLCECRNNAPLCQLLCNKIAGWCFLVANQAYGGKFVGQNQAVCLQIPDLSNTVNFLYQNTVSHLKLSPKRLHKTLFL